MSPDELCMARFGMDKRAMLSKLYGERRRELHRQSADEKAQGVRGPTRNWIEDTKKREAYEHSRWS